MSYDPLTPAGGSWKFVSSIHVKRANANEACQYIRWLERKEMSPQANVLTIWFPRAPPPPAGKDNFWKVLGMSAADS